jgi:uncharacterized damage-inducible protein DinB
MTLETLRYFYRYNAWATERVLTALEGLSEAEYTAPGCSGHGSIRDTLAHFLSTQQGWFSWFDGSMDVVASMKPAFGSADIPTVAAARERWTPIAERTDKLLARLTEEEVHGVRSWSVPGMPPGQAILWRLMLHVANHGTHTRAQIVAAIRRAGKEPGNIEMMSYIVTGPQ